MAILCRFCVVWKYGNIAQFRLDKRVVFLTFLPSTLSFRFLCQNNKNKRHGAKNKKNETRTGSGMIASQPKLEEKGCLVYWEKL